MPERTSVLFVCLGNICRSPMAEGLFTDLVRREGLADRFRIESAGTGSWHADERADPRTLEVLAKHGIQLDSRARQVQDEDFERFEWILAMDRSNLENLRSRCPTDFRSRLYLTLEPLGGGDVPDPYWGGPSGFDDNFALLTRALEAWLERLR